MIALLPGDEVPPPPSDYSHQVNIHVRDTSEKYWYTRPRTGFWLDSALYYRTVIKPFGFAANTTLSTSPFLQKKKQR